MSLAAKTAANRQGRFTLQFDPVDLRGWTYATGCAGRGAPPVRQRSSLFLRRTRNTPFRRCSCWYYMIHPGHHAAPR